VLSSTTKHLLAALCLVPGVLLGAEPGDEDPIHEELRTLRNGLIEAYNKDDIDQLLSYCHPNVIATWPNGEVSAGPEAVRAYYDRMMKGPNRVVAKLTADPQPDELSVLHGGTTAISRGKMNDRYQLTDGMNFDLNSRWSATAVKEGDKWLVASFHSSVNVFDNSILRMTVQRTLLWSGGIALVLGLVVGAVATRILRKPKTTL
jgi:ketosteroid isomerase-like protein